MTTCIGQLEIKADDGDIQVEPISWTDGAGGATSFVTFTNTGLTYFVNRKQGAIVDIMQSGASTTVLLKFKVNGKDTGVQKMCAAVVPTVNNRMPATYPIAAGAAVQISFSS